MKKIYIILVCVLAFSCSKYDDAWISGEFTSVSEYIDNIAARCNNFNKEIVAIKGLVTAIEKNDMVTNLLYLPEKNTLSLTFRDRGVITITISDGQNGTNVHTAPVISVRKDTDDVWYWTIDGVWLKDQYGNKVPTLNNSDVTPMVKIENDYWYVSYDGGVEWIGLCKAKGEDGTDGENGDLLVSAFTSDGQKVYITLNDGEQLVVPMEIPIDINIASPSKNITAGQTFTLAFEIVGSQNRPELTCIGEHGWRADVKWNSDTKGELIVTAPDELKSGKIVVFAASGEYMSMKAVNFNYDEVGLTVMSIINNFFEVDGGGGVVNVKLTTNQEYSIEIPDDAKSWITHIKTRAIREDDILFAVADNKSGDPERSAIIKFVGNGVNASVTISQRSKILLDSEIVLGPTDGFDNPTDGIVVLQTASKGIGTDIIIMGDGFSKRDFVQQMNYKIVMEQAYEDFFSIEPFASLKEYFNVYYINAVSENAHDAKPYYDSYGNQNGATNGSANTCFSTTFQPGSTSVSGNQTAVLNYAKQAIRYKGGPNGTVCSSESEVTTRANKALMIVMINVKCYAGTCYLTWQKNTTYDFGNAYSIAYCPLGRNGDREQRRMTLIHEAGGHGFGKLADEYESLSFTRFSTSVWNELAEHHSYGLDRNANEYWTYEESLNWSSLVWDYTTENNVYWAELLQSRYNYSATEGLGIYKGGYTYSNMFCRSTFNSVMRNQNIASGQYFNAISRWAIWYRVMRLTGSTSARNFKASINEFVAFDKTLSINYNATSSNVQGYPGTENEYKPLGKPQKQELMWNGEDLVPANYVLK